MSLYDASLFERSLQRKMKRKEPTVPTTVVDLSSINTENPFVQNILSGISRQGTGFLTTVDWVSASEKDLDDFEALLDHLSSRFVNTARLHGLEKYCAFVGKVMNLKPQHHEASDLLLF